MSNENINKVAEWLHKTDAPQDVITAWNKLMMEGN